MDEGHKINDKPSVHLKLEVESEQGDVYISCLCGSSDFDTNVKISRGELASFFCPNCEEELISDYDCQECRSAMVPLQIDKGGKIYICSKRGCKEHFLDVDNISQEDKDLYSRYNCI